MAASQGPGGDSHDCRIAYGNASNEAHMGSVVVGST